MISNKDMPAMPSQWKDFDSCGVEVTRESYHGLTKREMFAMHAPMVEVLFARDYAFRNNENKSLVVLYKSEGIYQLTLKGEMQLLKEWRYAYADMMLEEESCSQ